MTIARLDTLLCTLADPEAPAAAVPAELIDPLLQLARDHNVLPVVTRKLAPQHSTAALREAQGELTLLVGLSMHLRGIAAKVDRHIAENSLEAVIVIRHHRIDPSPISTSWWRPRPAPRSATC